DEVFILRSCRLSGSEESLIAYWNFDGGTFADLSGHDHVIVGGTGTVSVYNDDSLHQGCGASRFTAYKLTAEGFSYLTLIGRAGLSYQIDVSTNLLDWSFLTVLTNSQGSVQFTDTVATNYRTRFYRAVVP